MTNDAVVCEKCGGELETSLVWDKCLKCGHLQNPHFENELATYRHQNRKHGHYFKDSKLDFIKDTLERCLELLSIGGDDE